jgi:pimeloyl-ACP methyl ester carboxylesterase/DNA-binding winged helix-turn-helix (wHTH) protein
MCTDRRRSLGAELENSWRDSASCGYGRLTSYSFGAFSLDLERFRLERAGQPVHVERQVFDVLAYLIAHRDRVVAKTELLDNVWGDRFVSESALSSRIKAARRAVDDDGARQDVIRTVFGRGYQFVAEVRGEPSVERPTAAPAAVAIEQKILFCHADDGTRIAYSLVGEGPTLVKAANWMTHLVFDHESRVWRHWTEDLAAGRTLLRYDERGCGMSDWDVDRFDFDAWVEDLEVVVDSAGLDRFPLLGVSQGGAVAVAFAVRHPERVSRMVLYGSYARGRRVRAADAGSRDEAALDIELARVGWGRDDPSFRQVFTSQFLPDGSRADWDEFNDFLRRTTSPDNAVRFLETFAEIDVTGEAPKVSCPTLVVHARDDHRVPASAARELAALIPGSRFVLLPGRNHLLRRDESAWPQFLAELDRFLAE